MNVYLGLDNAYPEIASAAAAIGGGLHDYRVQISVIIPTHNGENKISLLLAKIHEFLSTSFQSYEVLIINDGSLDNTLAVLRKEQEANSHIKIISYAQNHGKGHAVKTGIMHSCGDVIIFVDGDLDISPNAIGDYVKELENCDLVIASKRHPLSRVKAPLSRKFLSRVFNLIIRMLIGIKVKDTQSGLKAGKGVALRTIFGSVVVKRYAFDVELLTIASLLGLKIREMPIEINLDHRFKFQDIVKMILDVAGIWYRYRITHGYVIRH
jgi:dolichol-phosphate mannosyltransferase